MMAMKASLSMGFSRHLKIRNYVSFSVLPHCSGIFSHGYCEPIAGGAEAGMVEDCLREMLTGANPLPVYMGSVYPIRTGVGLGRLATSLF